MQIKNSRKHSRIECIPIIKTEQDLLVHVINKKYILKFPVGKEIFDWKNVKSVTNINRIFFEKTEKKIITKKLFVSLTTELADTKLRKWKST